MFDLKDAAHGVLVWCSGGAVSVQTANHSAAFSLFSPLHFCAFCRDVKRLSKAKGNYNLYPRVRTAPVYKPLVNFVR